MLSPRLEIIYLTIKILRWRCVSSSHRHHFPPILLSVIERTMIDITPNISLQEDELSFTAMRASGPGGQHVNTTNSAVQLRFDASNSPALTPAVFSRLKTLAGQRMTTDGVIILQVSDNRSQHRNRAIAVERLCGLIRSALTPPRPRRKTRPSRNSISRRLDGKAHKGNLKKTRGRVKDTN